MRRDNVILNFLHYHEQSFCVFSEGDQYLAEKFEILTRNNILYHVQVAKLVEKFIPEIMTFRTGVVWYSYIPPKFFDKKQKQQKETSLFGT